MLLDRETVEARCLPHLPTHPMRILCEWEYVEGILLQRSLQSPKGAELLTGNRWDDQPFTQKKIPAHRP